MREVFIAGGGMVPVGKYAEGTGRSVAREAAVAALEDAGCTYADIDAFIAGSAHPTSPRAAFVAKQLGLTGIPVQQVINASASGSSAIHSAIMAVESGRHDLVLVVGYDVPDRAENSLAAQGYQPPVTLFAQWAMRRMHDAGTKPEHLAMIAAKNWNYARSNRFAARQSDHEVTVEEVLSSKVVAAPLTAMMSTPWCLGAAAVIVASSEGLAKLQTGRRTVAKVRASEFQSEQYEDYHIFDGAITGPASMTRSTADAAYLSSGLKPAEVDVVQVHDAFAIEELVYMELLGFSLPGETEGLVEQGAFGPGSRKAFGLPEFSTDGGLIARGHPGGPTGVLQVVETLRRFRETDDRIGLCHMLGAGSVCTVQIFEKFDA
ncbi:MAG: thiolase family protein [Sphingomonadales bacterium]|nr:thiolase family protein [Sphingomonadaceae bacterium]MBS3932537.1 thiolase family protein [Sphingomonadales bacterium]